MVFLNETLGHTLYMGVYIYFCITMKNNNENCHYDYYEDILKIKKITRLLSQMTSFYIVIH